MQTISVRESLHQNVSSITSNSRASMTSTISPQDFISIKEELVALFVKKDTVLSTNLITTGFVQTAKFCNNNFYLQTHSIFYTVKITTSMTMSLNAKSVTVDTFQSMELESVLPKLPIQSTVQWLKTVPSVSLVMMTMFQSTVSVLPRASTIVLSITTPLVPLLKSAMNVKKATIQKPTNAYKEQWKIV